VGRNALIGFFLDRMVEIVPLWARKEPTLRKSFPTFLTPFGRANAADHAAIFDMIPTGSDDALHRSTTARRGRGISLLTAWRTLVYVVNIPAARRVFFVSCLQEITSELTP
jgi:hypothetical protein